VQLHSHCEQAHPWIPRSVIQTSDCPIRPLFLPKEVRSVSFSSWRFKVRQPTWRIERLTTGYAVREFRDDSQGRYWYVVNALRGHCRSISADLSSTSRDQRCQLHTRSPLSSRSTSVTSPFTTSRVRMRSAAIAPLTRENSLRQALCRGGIDAAGGEPDHLGLN
jgi:hypothetical protein